MPYKARWGERRTIMKSIIKKMTVFGLVAAMFFSVAVVPSSAASSSMPRIKKVEYEGRGVIEVDFYGKVRYGTYGPSSVTVKDLKGRSYTAAILERDGDDLKFRIKNYRKNHTYKFTINQVRKWNSSRYYNLTRTIGIEIKKSASSTGNSLITATRARQIATGAVGLSTSQVRFIKTKLDYDDGVRVYEVEFIRGYYEYEFEINARTGGIKSKHIEYMD